MMKEEKKKTTDEEWARAFDTIIFDQQLASCNGRVHSTIQHQTTATIDNDDQQPKNYTFTNAWPEFFSRLIVTFARQNSVFSWIEI